MVDRFRDILVETESVELKKRRNHAGVPGAESERPTAELVWPIAVLEWPKAVRAYLWRGFVRVPLVVNVCLNAVLPWLLFGGVLSEGRDALPIVGGPESLHREMIGTAILLPLLTAWICGWILRRRIASSAELPLPNFVVTRVTQAESLNPGGARRASQFIRNTVWMMGARVTGRGSWRGGFLYAVLCGGVIYLTGWLVVVVMLDQAVAPVPEISISTLSIVKAVFAGVHGCWVTPLYAAFVLAAEAAKRSEESSGCERP